MKYLRFLGPLKQHFVYSKSLSKSFKIITDQSFAVEDNLFDGPQT